MAKARRRDIIDHTEIPQVTTSKPLESLSGNQRCAAGFPAAVAKKGNHSCSMKWCDLNGL